ncbi:MAG TPA: type I restriction enzyme endonuclease domain-containing protein, partial [Thermoanaerobaculia bacterium]|nr:type I restriction enzyme endonuclease domain-containing protein [Thermoanaerobaculia bacterium]
TVYLDKPMHNHTLMQTVARANRVFPGKHSGVIVDYANVFASLERALAIYATAGGGHRPLRDKDELVGQLRDALWTLAGFCATVGVSLDTIEEARAALVRLTSVDNAVNALIAPDDRRKAFLTQVQLVERLYAAVKPHRSAAEFAPRMTTLAALAGKIRAEITPERADITTVLRTIGEVLDRSIAGSEIREVSVAIDLSRVDFRALAARFEGSRTKDLDLERLKAAIRCQLDRLIKVNETRVDFRAKFEALIEDYNTGSTQIEQLFQQLVELSRSLSDEAARHVREHLTEDELVVFDLLTRPGPDLSTAERDEVKKVARNLLAKLRATLTVDWQKTAYSRARVREAIAVTLDDGLPRAYTPAVFQEKAGVVFQHVYERHGWAA